MRVVEMLGLTQYEYTFTKLKNCDDVKQDKEKAWKEHGYE